jgi:hypothetical protein
MKKENNDGFTINVNSPGNFIAREITFSGTVNIGGANTETVGYSDEQIAQALTNIVGKGKAIDSKRKWAGAYWGLRWYCNFPTSTKDFCDRIKALPLGQLECECDYDNIRRFTSMAFMEENPRFMDRIKPSASEKESFCQCREVVLALVAELGKSALPKVEI